MRLPTKELHTSPPDDWVANPFFGFPDPIIPRTIVELGVEDIIKRMIFETNYKQGKVGVNISQRDAAYLTYDQRWIIHCNMLWAIHSFLGSPMTPKTVNNMKSVVGNIVGWLANIESKPGDFGQNDIG